MAANSIIRPVGLLCTTVWITCAQQRETCVRCGEMLGMAFRTGAHDGAFTWAIAIHVLCIKKNLPFSTRHAVVVNN